MRGVARACARFSFLCVRGLGRSGGGCGGLTIFVAPPLLSELLMLLPRSSLLLWVDVFRVALLPSAKLYARSFSLIVSHKASRGRSFPNSSLPRPFHKQARLTRRASCA